jgi:ketosteroid isomerase-like protein
MISKGSRAITAVLLLSTCLFSVAGCGKGRDQAERTKEGAKPSGGGGSQALIEADCEFASMAADSGLAAAFVFFAADSATMLRDGSLPIIGKEAIRGLFSGPDRGTLTWEPYFAELASSGDLGYTLGEYQFAPKDTSGGKKMPHGYYVTIWKKQPHGSWKYVLDTGVQGP